MAFSSAREVARQSLRRWRQTTEFAGAILQRERRSLDQETDRAFLQELFYGVLRHRSLIDALIAKLRRDPVDDETRDVLQLGLYQLLFLRTPPHAAVNETVDLAPRRARGVVNGVLRRASREEEGLRAWRSGLPLALRESHPEFLVERWIQSFGEQDAAALCRWNNQPAPLYARVNTLRSSAEKFRQENAEVEAVPEQPEFFRCPRLPGVAIARGDCYMQDPSTALAVQFLQTKAGDRVLDACAAPGGKTSYLAARTNNEANLLACDDAAERLELLRSNLNRLGVNAEILQNDWRVGPSLTDRSFDKILVDAPCSNTGVMRRRVDVRWRLRPDEFQRMQEQQLQILRGVAPLLAPGGQLVYSTCSLEAEENEAVIRRFLHEQAEYEVTQTARVLPFRDNFDGAFAARLQRRSPSK